MAKTFKRLGQTFRDLNKSELKEFDFLKGEMSLKECGIAKNPDKSILLYYPSDISDHGQTPKLLFFPKDYQECPPEIWTLT